MNDLKSTQKTSGLSGDAFVAIILSLFLIANGSFDVSNHVLIGWVKIIAGITIAALSMIKHFKKKEEQINEIPVESLYPENSETVIRSFDEADQFLKTSKSGLYNFELSESEYDELAKRHPFKKIFRLYPLTLKIEKNLRYKEIENSLKYLSFKYGGVFKQEDQKTFLLIKTTVEECNYKKDLPQLLKPYSRLVTVEYRKKFYNFSKFKSAVYKYDNFEITRIEDYFLEREENSNVAANTKIRDFSGECNFTAIDFETANSNRSSACAIGIVKVRKGIITEETYQLIDPEEEFHYRNIGIHGITPEHVVGKPNFEEFWQTTLKDIILNEIIIGHNAASVEISIIRACLGKYELKPVPFKYGCTMVAAKKEGYPTKLSGLSKKLDIDLDHHQALSDAIACARIGIFFFKLSNSFDALGLIEFEMKKINFPNSTSSNINYQSKANPTPQIEYVSEIPYDENYFLDKSLVITGVLNSYPVRDDLIALLLSKGAIIRSSISKRTDIVIVGLGAGPSKLLKVAELQQNGIQILCIREPLLVTLLNS